MYSVAISYRRTDTKGTVGRIFDALEQRYGPGSVFMDVSTVPFGTDFRRHIANSISQSDCLLVVIGSQWLVDDEQGRSRIMLEEDIVRVEIQTAMSKGIPVIPVLIDAAPMPSPRDLPPDIQNISFINAAPIDSGRDFRPNVMRLLASIDQLISRDTDTSPAKSNSSRSISALVDDTPVDDAELLDGDEMDEAATRLGSRDNLAGRIEQFVMQRGSHELGIAAVVLGFLLSFLSEVFGLGWLTYHQDNGIEKQVGFLSAPNWTIVYILLFPPYLAFFSVFVVRGNYLLRRLCSKTLVEPAHGSSSGKQPSILERWHRSLKIMSTFFWFLLIAVAVEAASEWWKFCYTPLATGKIGHASVDWIKLAVVDPAQAGWWSSVVFSAIAFSYMALALFVYLAILIYFAFFAGFIHRISYGKDRILASRELNALLSAIMTPVYVCAMLGVGAAICMRMQAQYIKSEYSIIHDFVFSDVRSVIMRINGDREHLPPPRPMQIPSEWTSLAEMTFTLLVLGLVLYLLYDIFERAKRFGAKRKRRPDRPAGVRGGDETPSFLRSVVPHHRQFHVILAGEILTFFFMGYGSILLITIAYAAIQIFLLPKLDENAHPAITMLDSREDAPDARPGRADIEQKPIPRA